MIKHICLVVPLLSYASLTFAAAAPASATPSPGTPGAPGSITTPGSNSPGPTTPVTSTPTTPGTPAVGSAGQPRVYGGLKPKIAGTSTSDATPTEGGDEPADKLMQMIAALMGGKPQTPQQRREAAAANARMTEDGWDVGSSMPSDAPGEATDFNSFKYPDSTNFGYGGRGAGNVGNGLCTQKNENTSQVKNGYCQMLAESLNKEGSCANREMNKIIAIAGPTGSGFGGMNQYCSTWSKMNGSAQKSLVFQQILSGLITQESGWKPTAAEPTWFKGSKQMGGKGLFQIGVNDRRQDPDCAGLTDSSIRDPGVNIKCGACIALKYMAQDRTMGHGVGDGGARGAARYFGPFRDGQAPKRNAIANSSNQYCKAATGESGSSEQQRLAAVTGRGARSPASGAGGGAGTSTAAR